MEQRSVTWKWHDFMTGFGLYAIAVVNGLSALYLLFLSLSGQARGMLIPIMGSALVALFAYGAAGELKARKKDGISSLMYMYGINIAVGVVMCLNNPDIGASYLEMVAAGVGMYLANKQYYNKRMSYFSD